MPFRLNVSPVSTSLAPDKKLYIPLLSSLIVMVYQVATGLSFVQFILIVPVIISDKAHHK
jgi:hypothetical protein